MKSNNEKGYSLLEVIVTTGLIVILFAGFTTILQLYSNSQQNLAYSDRKQDILVSIVNLINNEIAWQKTIDLATNTNLDCLKEKAKFPLVSNAGACTAADGGKFSLVDEASAPFLDNLVPTAGFSLSGGTCNTYTPAGDDTCPLRAEVTWRPICTTCNLNQIEITVELFDSPSTRKNTSGPVLTRRIVRYAQPFDQDWTLYLKMDGILGGPAALGSAINDFSGNRNHATVAEWGPGAMPSFQTGHVGHSLQMNPNKYLSISDTPSLRPGMISIAAWIYVDAASPNAPIVSKNNVGLFDSYSLRLTSPGLTFCVAETPATGNHCAVVNPGVATGVWHHVVGVWDTQTISIYFNGVLAGSSAYAGPNVWSANPVLIGTQDHAGLGPAFPGRIDQVKIWKRALKLIEVQREFANP